MATVQRGHARQCGVSCSVTQGNMIRQTSTEGHESLAILCSLRGHIHAGGLSHGDYCRILLIQHGKGEPCKEDLQFRQPLGLVVPNRLPPLPPVDCRLDNAAQVRPPIPPPNCPNSDRARFCAFISAGGDTAWRKGGATRGL